MSKLPVGNERPRVPPNIRLPKTEETPPLIAAVKIQRRGAKVEAQIESPLSNGEEPIELDSSPVFYAFEDQGEYVLVSMSVLDEQSAIEFFARQSPIQITLKSPSATRIISL